MPLTLQDLIAKPERISELRPPVEKCSTCKVELQETITGKHHTEDGIFCSDHYYQILGDVIEAHPIVSGGSRRG